MVVAMWYVQFVDIYGTGITCLYEFVLLLFYIMD